MTHKSFKNNVGVGEFLILDLSFLIFAFHHNERRQNVKKKFRLRLGRYRSSRQNINTFRLFKELKGIVSGRARKYEYVTHKHSWTFYKLFLSYGVIKKQRTTFPLFFFFDLCLPSVTQTKGINPR